MWCQYLKLWVTYSDNDTLGRSEAWLNALIALYCISPAGLIYNIWLSQNWSHSNSDCNEQWHFLESPCVDLLFRLRILFVGLASLAMGVFTFFIGSAQLIEGWMFGLLFGLPGGLIAMRGLVWIIVPLAAFNGHTVDIGVNLRQALFGFECASGACIAGAGVVQCSTRFRAVWRRIGCSLERSCRVVSPQI